MDERERVARAICAEKCAFMGEPPCHSVEGEWPNPNCSEPGCHAEAQAAIAALEPMDKPRVKPLVWAESIAQISYFANSCVGEYRITKTRNTRNDKWGVSYIDPNRRSHGVGYIDGIESAKDASQADYEARILAALE